MPEDKKHRHEEEEEFGELIKFTFAGFAGGLSLGWLLDRLGFQQNPVGEWAVRTLTGEGERILEGVFSIKKRLSGSATGLPLAGLLHTLLLRHERPARCKRLRLYLHLQARREPKESLRQMHKEPLNAHEPSGDTHSPSGIAYCKASGIFSHHQPFRSP